MFDDDPTEEIPAVPAYPPTPHPRRARRWPWITASIAGAVVLAGLGIGGYAVFGPQNHTEPKPAAITAHASEQPTQQAPTTVIQQQPETRTVTVPGPTREVPAVPYADVPVTTLDAEPFSCSSDGTRLTANVSITNPTDSTHDFIGTLDFGELGQGGFSVVSLAPGQTKTATVDTDDPNDPRARTGDLSGTAGTEIFCFTSDLHTK